MALELIKLSDPVPTTSLLVAKLQDVPFTDEGSKTLQLGFFVMGKLLEEKKAYIPTDAEMENMYGVVQRCIVAADSGVRKELMGFVVQLCEKVGEERFWGAFGDLAGNYKSLVIYFVESGRKKAAEVSA